MKYEDNKYEKLIKEYKFDKNAGLRFKELRVLSGHTVPEVESKTGISKDIIYKIEQGKTQPNPYIIHLLHTVYKCRYLDLFKVARLPIPNDIGYTSNSLNRLNQKEISVVKDIIDLLKNNEYIYRALH